MSNAVLSPPSTATPHGATTLRLELSAQGAIQAIDAPCTELTGFSSQELSERPLWSALLIPEEVALFKEMLGRLQDDVDLIEFESHVVTKHGERRRMAWSCSALRDERRALSKIVCKGRELPEQISADPLHSVHVEQRGHSGEDSLVSTSQGKIRERRARRRTAYPYQQLIAPLTGKTVPSRSAFRPVQCREIAAGGFSFLAPIPPGYDRLVVAFGTAPATIYLSAKIKHVTPTEHGGKKMFHVGCEYTERLNGSSR